MIILGIDPGTRRAGFGIIRSTGATAELLEAGILEAAHENEQAALGEMRAHFLALVAKHRPEALAIEKLFFAKNRKTALRVAEARGVILEAATACHLTIYEFSPNEVKANIAGYGGADKRAVAKMVRLILRTPDLRVIDDASDALALALLGARHHGAQK